MEEFKLIVAGSRDFNDAAVLAKTIDTLATGPYDARAVSIVSGMARGADRLAMDFALENGIECYEFPADWNQHGKRAGFLRNEEMGKFADGLLAFWDGESAGTEHMINYMLKLNKWVHVVLYKQSNAIWTLN